MTKAVIPAAGLGTRFLPMTKASPKEMLPIVDKPVIQYVVEELVAAGITDIFIVTGANKRSIEDHFDAPSTELENILINGGEKKKKLLEQIQQIGSMANFVYVRQKGPYGNGTPLLNVRPLMNGESFLYLWGDDFIKAEPVSRVSQLMEVYDKYKCSVLGCIRAGNDDDYKRYGYVAGKEIEKGLVDVDRVIEKPGRENAPSDLASVSGFLLTADIFEYLDKVLEDLKPGQELYYNDMMKLMLLGGKRILAKEIIGGKYYDTGSKLEYMKTVVELGMKHEGIGEEFTKFLRGLKF